MKAATTAGEEPEPRQPPALLLGIPIDDVTMAATLDIIDDFVRAGRRTGATHQIATVNVDFLVNAIADDGLREVLQHTDLNLADGMPVVWGARRVGAVMRERVAGSDLVAALAASSTARGWKISFFGSGDGIAERAAAMLRDEHPGASIAGWSGPMIADVDHVDDDVLERIASGRPDLLGVALGNPKQELFIRANATRLGIPVMIGIGGSLDMLVGRRRRAPAWMQRTGLEWIYRAGQEPARLGRRYAHDARVFLPALARDLRAARASGRGTGLVITADGRIELGPVPPGDTSAWRAGVDALGDRQALHVALGTAPAVTRSGLAQLIDLSRRARRAGTPMDLHGGSAVIRAALSDVGLSAHLDPT